MLLAAYALGLAGWQAGEFYLKYVEFFDRFEHQILIGVVAVIALTIAYYLYRRAKKRRR